MRVVVLFLVAFLGIVLRDTVFNGLSVAGGKPDFVLIMVVYFAIFRGSVQGGLLGTALGLLEDLMTGRFIGINAICKGLIGYAAGYSERNLANMKRFAKEYPHFPFLQVPLAELLGIAQLSSPGSGGRLVALRIESFCPLITTSEPLA